MIREEVSPCVTGRQLTATELKEVVLGVLQLAIDDFGSINGVPTNSARFCSRLARSRLLAEDRQEIVRDVSSKIFLRVTTLLPNTYLQYNFCYKTLYTGDILVGLDPREFVNEPNDVCSITGHTETF